ncbi:MAG: CHASE domain-containing protein [Burkholderiales bacterium]|nr:CHASE domain-containing protein [Burkholderiales bacterium]
MKQPSRLHATIVLSCGLVFTALVVIVLASTMAQRDRLSFESNARAAQAVVLDRIEVSIALLRGAAGLFASHTGEPTVSEFRDFMNRTALRDAYPGILGIGYSRRVPADERDAVERALQAQGQQDFRIWPQDAREQWHAIVFLEPLDARNRAAIGYDMFTQPLRRAAMERARDSGAPAASAVVQLVQEIDARKQPGFLLYLPVYRGPAEPPSLAERRERLRGFVYAPIRAVDFISSAFAHAPGPSIALRVVHEYEPGKETLLYQHASADQRSRGLYSLKTRADVAGQVWQFESWSSTTLGEALVVPLLVAVAGIGISLALALLLWREDQARAAIQVALEREQAARAQAERANRMKDEFLATLSHELRTPLNAIVGWASVLRAGRVSGQQASAALEVIDRNARAQARLIEDLLDTNRIVSGKLSMDSKPLDAAAVLEAALDTVLPVAKQKRIELRKQVAAEPLTIRGDSARLQQVIWNLLSNAIKFTPAGGRIDVSLERVDRVVRLQIADTGEGIDARFLEHIFDRFLQADGTITRRHGGLGLGLAIVRELVTMHGGEVRASSAGPGKGATFVVELPLHFGEHAAAGAEGQAPWEALLDGVKVLVVDDDADARRLIRLMLEQRRAQVWCAGSAEEALQALDALRPDVLVSDIGMAEIDGYALMRRIRARPTAYFAALPSVALTAYARNEDRVEAFRAGFHEYLVKPVQPERLVGVVARLAGRSDTSGIALPASEDEASGVIVSADASRADPSS